MIPPEEEDKLPIPKKAEEEEKLKEKEVDKNCDTNSSGVESDFEEYGEEKNEVYLYLEEKEEEEQKRLELELEKSKEGCSEEKEENKGGMIASQQTDEKGEVTCLFQFEDVEKEIQRKFSYLFIF